MYFKQSLIFLPFTAACVEVRRLEIAQFILVGHFFYFCPFFFLKYRLFYNLTFIQLVNSVLGFEGLFLLSTVDLGIHNRCNFQNSPTIYTMKRTRLLLLARAIALPFIWYVMHKHSQLTGSKVCAVPRTAYITTRTWKMIYHTFRNSYARLHNSPSDNLMFTY